MQKKSAVRSS